MTACQDAQQRPLINKILCYSFLQVKLACSGVGRDKKIVVSKIRGTFLVVSQDHRILGSTLESSYARKLAIEAG